MKQLTVQELAMWLEDTSLLQPALLDVREPWEFEFCRIPGSQNFPLNSIPQVLPDLKKDSPLVLVCHHGMRSYQAAVYLMRQGFSEVYNLTGGVSAWSNEIDPKMPRY